MAIQTISAKQHHRHFECPLIFSVLMQFLGNKLRVDCDIRMLCSTLDERASEIKRSSVQRYA